MTTLVIGAAISGRAATRLLRSQGEKVIVYDADPGALVGVDADLTHGGSWDPSLLDGVDLVVPSPGVPEHAPPVAAAIAAGLTVWSELELGLSQRGAPNPGGDRHQRQDDRHRDCCVDVERIGSARRRGGKHRGTALRRRPRDWDVLVVEASSFQLRFVDTFHATVAVLLNIAPDHFDWHLTMAAYVAAKQRVLERQTPDDIVVFDADDPGAVAAVSSASARLVPVSATRVPDGGWGVNGGVLTVGAAAIPLASMHRSDAAFVIDVAAAAAGAFHLGANPSAVERVAVTYRPGKHRRQIVGSWNGVTWIDDSKATNPHAALAAIRAYPSVVLIAGGGRRDST